MRAIWQHLLHTKNNHDILFGPWSSKVISLLISHMWRILRISESADEETSSLDESLVKEDGDDLGGEGGEPNPLDREGWIDSLVGG